MADELHVEVSETVRAWSVVVRGEIDMQTAAQLEGVLDDVIAKGARLVTLDLEQVDFLDSSGLRVILGASNKLGEQEGQLLLEGASSAVERVLELTGVIERLRQSRRPERHALKTSHYPRGTICRATSAHRSTEPSA